MDTSVEKLFIDINVFLATIGKRSPFRWIFEKILAGEFVLCLSNQILLEYAEVLARKNGAEVSSNVVNFLRVHPFVLHQEPFFHFHLIAADPDDDKYVDCAIAAGADCLVSDDAHFRVLRQIPFPQVRVFTLKEFCEKHGFPYELPNQK